MENPIVKATAIMDAKIQFVSLVDKAANKRKFLITKADGGNANFQTYGCILKSEAETHYITGIVYEPMVEDTDKNYMTAAEIAKAEKYFTENSGSIDIQHSFETEENVSVVESWITKCDCSINGKEVKKGTWLMTVKVEDDDIWDKVEKGEITGFSMGGVGKYSDEDVDLSDITDDETSVEKAEKKSLFVKLANAFGYDCVKKGEVADRFTDSARNNNFWTAFNSLENTLRKYDNFSGKYVYETDVSVIKSALEEFNQILTDVLSSDDGIVKAVVKPNACKPDDEEDSQSDTRTKSNTKTQTKKNETEEKKLTKEELVSIIKSTVSDTIKDVFPADAEVEEEVTKKDKSLGEMTSGEVQDIIKSTVSEEIKKYAAARGKATNLDAEEEEVEKSEEPEHYMHGIL